MAIAAYSGSLVELVPKHGDAYNWLAVECCFIDAVAARMGDKSLH